MKFELKSANGCRLAVMSSIGKGPKEDTITTPACLLYTRGGSVPHLTIDTLQKIPNQPGIVHLNVPSFIEYRETIECFRDGLARFVGMPETLTMLTVQDPGKAAPSGYNDKSSVSVWAPSGRVKLDADSYMLFQRAAKPDILEALCDGDTPSGCNKKRVLRAVTRTLQLLDQCLEKINELDEPPPEVFGVIEGGDMLSERLRSAKETVKRPVSGFVLDSFGEHYMEAETRWKLLDNILKELPVDKPRMLPQVGHPMEVLLAVEGGIDLFDSVYPCQMTEAGKALVFTWDHGDGTSRNRELGKPVQEGPIINLNEKRYFEDLSPVLQGCQCYCCSHHTRAYINHLLVTKELLAGVLLMSHNLHHYLGFFQGLRTSIETDSFDSFKEHIQSQFAMADR